MHNLDSITVAELINILQQQDLNAQVVFAVNYGDRARTMQAIPLRGECEEVAIRKSGYSESGFAVDEDACGANDYEIDVTYLRIR